MTNPNWWDVQSLAAFSHDVYEAEAVKAGWKTQEQCRVPFDELPEANKAVMLAVASAIIAEVQKRGETKKAKIITSDGIQSEWSCGNCKNELSHTEIDGSYCLWCGAEFE